MTSAFEPFANALLTFKVDTGFSRRDDRTGNLIPISEERQIRALIPQPELKSRTNYATGPDRETVRIQGRAVEPSILPNWVRPGGIATVAIVDPLSGAEFYGRLTLTSIQQSPFPAVTQALGSFFEGDFVIQGDGEVAYES